MATRFLCGYQASLWRRRPPMEGLQNRLCWVVRNGATAAIFHQPGTASRRVGIAFTALRYPTSP